MWIVIIFFKFELFIKNKFFYLKINFLQNGNKNL